LLIRKCKAIAIIANCRNLKLLYFVKPFKPGRRSHDFIFLKYKYAANGAGKEEKASKSAPGDSFFR